MLEFLRKIYAWLMLVINHHRRVNFRIIDKTRENSAGYIIHFIYIEKNKIIAKSVEELFVDKLLLKQFDTDDVIEIGRLYAKYKFSQNQNNPAVY
ncbi:MAG: hypothetical protein KBD37_04025 [Burkholderiales bacterium]|nr:hypothetical protein [Burkholderiales bacterium]